MIAAGVHAFGAAFAFGRIDEDSELSTLAWILLFDHVEVLIGYRPLCAHGFAGLFIGDPRESIFQRAGLDNFAEDRGVRAFGDAIHTADTIFSYEFRNVRSDIAEIPERAGGCRDNASRDLIVGFETFFSCAVVVGSNNARVEVLGIDNIYADVFCEFFNRDIDSLIHYLLTPLISVGPLASTALRSGFCRGFPS